METVLRSEDASMLSLRRQRGSYLRVHLVCMRFGIVVEHPFLSLQLDGLRVLLELGKVGFVPFVASYGRSAYCAYNASTRRRRPSESKSIV